MRTAYQVITVATKSSAECAASESSASEPEKRPTTALAIVSPPEAAIEVSATRSLVSCINTPLSSRTRRRREPGSIEHQTATCGTWVPALAPLGRDDKSGCSTD